MGLSYARGQYVVFLNVDTYVSSRWLEELVKVLDGYRQVGACQSKTLSANTGKVQTIGNCCDIYWGMRYGLQWPCPKPKGKASVLVDAYFYPSLFR